MQRRRALEPWVLAVSLAFSLSGCISINTEPEHFNVPVQARTISDIPPPAQAAALAAQAAPEAARRERPPVRENIKGAGDGAKNPDRVVVTADADDVRHTVPDFSAEQIAAMVCRSQRGRNAQILERGVKAWETTLTHRTALADWEARKLPLKKLNDAERARQSAVKSYRGNNTWLVSLLGGMQKKKDLPKPQAGPLVLENIDLFTFTENGVPVMAVSGTIRNTGAGIAEVPPVTLQSIDQWEFLLAGQTSLLPFEQLGPQEARTFEIRFLNPPETTAEVYAHFAPPFEYRAYRACENFDPRDAKPETADTKPETPTGPIHAAAELNELTRFYRTQAQNSWTCRKGEDGVEDRGAGLRVAVDGSGERLEGGSISLGSPNLTLLCASWRERMRWRDTFILAEATDEAWAALTAHDDAERRFTEGKATQADLDAAKAAQERAYAYVRLLGQGALARTGASARGVAVDVSSASFGFEKGGRYVSISGQLRNTGADAASLSGLMLAIVDRLDMPLLTLAIDNPVTLAPGETTTFTRKLRLNAAPPLTGPWGEAPAWQVRLGAIGK
jgi:hypothetical protein